MPDSRIPFGETSAAQNGTVIKTCQHCGAINGETSDLCCFCDAPLGERGRPASTRRVQTATEGNLAVNPDWRREVSNRLQDFRTRRRGAPAAELQSALPFEPDLTSAGEIPVAGEKFTPPDPTKQRVASQKPRRERIEISVPNPTEASSIALGQSPAYSNTAFNLLHSPLRPVASLGERRRAALLDAVLLLFSYGGMLALFSTLGGHIGLTRLDLFVAGVTFALFYAQYFALFTVFGGSTPGMMWRGLRVVSFDGGTPTSRQMAWRSFGYLLSAGTCLLGFLWALWDEDHLCWQDHISQTYLTPIEEITRP